VPDAVAILRDLGRHLLNGTRIWLSGASFAAVEADLIYDTTRSYSDSIGSALVARKETYEGRNGRTQ
jgi:hypothetical protein